MNQNPSGVRELLFYDLETTGLDSKRCSIVQFGAIVVDPISLEEISGHSIKMFPRQGSWITPEAIEVNGYNEDKWREDGALHWSKAVHLIYELMKGRSLGGHNITKFDNNFMEEFFLLARGSMLIFDDEYQNFFSNCIDTLKLARELKVKELVDVRGKGLWSLALGFGIVQPTDDRGKHDALYDCRLTLKVYKEMMQRYGAKL